MTTTDLPPRRRGADGPLGTFGTFAAALAERVPGVPAGALPTFDITRHGMLDHVQRTWLRRHAGLFAPDVDPVAIDGCRTLGELHDLIGGPPYRSGLVRATYAGPTTHLRPLEVEDLPALYRASLEPTSSFRWRYRGKTPGPQEFEETLHLGVVSQFAVADPATDHLLGLVSAYNHRPEARSCHLAFLRCADAPRTGTATGTGTGTTGGELVEGACLFLDYLFATFDLHRVRMEVPEYNLHLVHGLIGSVLEREGELKEFVWHDRSAWSMHLLAIERTTWDRVVGPWFAADAAVPSGMAS